MYDELISYLRICGRINSANDNCIAFRDGSCEAEPVCMYELMGKAADAIENTSKAYNMMAEAYEAEVKRQWWIPVEERLPKYGERVLVFGGVTMYVAYYDKNRYGGESWHKLNSKSHYCNPTHWMPLPEPPTAEEGET